MSINNATAKEWDAARRSQSVFKERAEVAERLPFAQYTPEVEDGTGNPKARVGALKAPLHLVPPALIIGVSYALKDGAAKYGAYNWRAEPINVSTYIGAIQRHLMAYQDGEDVAEDSGVDHLAHAAACIALLMDSKAHGSLIDDRYAGPASKVLKEKLP